MQIGKGSAAATSAEAVSQFSRICLAGPAGSESQSAAELQELVEIKDRQVNDGVISPVPTMQAENIDSLHRLHQAQMGTNVASSSSAVLGDV